MGIIIGFGLAVGIAIGLVVSVASGGLALVITITAANRRLHVWRVMAVATPVIAIALLLLVGQCANQPAKPGNDYDIVISNFFIAGLGYAATPGIAAFLAALVSIFCPKRLATDACELESSDPPLAA